MRILVLASFFIIAFEARAVEVGDLYGKGPITGLLGVPIGTVVKIKGDITLHDHGEVWHPSVSSHHIMVREVNGKSVGIGFWLKSSRLSPVEDLIEARGVEFWAYETGGYLGDPKGMKTDNTGSSFGFSVWLVYLGDNGNK